MGIADLQSVPIDTTTATPPATSGGISSLKSIPLSTAIATPAPVKQPVDTSKMFSSFTTPNMTMEGSTPAVDTKNIAPDNSKIGMVNNFISGLPSAAVKVGQYLYDQGAQVIAPGITKDEANDPSFLLTKVAPEAASTAYNIGKDIITHPIVSGSQIARGTVLGALNFLSNAIVNYVPGLVPNATKKYTLQIMQNAFRKTLFPQGESDLGRGFEQGGGAAIPIVASALTAGEGSAAGQFFGGAQGFIAAEQTQLPSDATLKQRAQAALDSLVQQGILTTGTAGYNIAKGIITEGTLNAYHEAGGKSTTDGKGIADLHQEINDTTAKHGEAVTKTALTEKGVDAETADHLMRTAKTTQAMEAAAKPKVEETTQEESAKQGIERLKNTISEKIGEDSTQALKSIGISSTNDTSAGLAYKFINDSGKSLEENIKNLYNFYANKESKPIVSDVFFGSNPDNPFEGMKMTGSDKEPDENILQKVRSIVGEIENERSINNETSVVKAEENAPIVPAAEQRTISEPVAKEEGQTPSGLGKSIEAKAIEAELTKGFSNVAGFDSSNIKEQSELTSNLINSGINNAMDVVSGHTPLPDRMRGGSLIIAMEKYVKDNLNNPDMKGQLADIQEKLANSPLTSGVSQGASELGLMQNREQDSATAKLQEMRKAKEAAAGGEKVIKPERKLINTENKKITLSKEDLSWENFLNTIQC